MQLRQRAWLQRLKCVVRCACRGSNGFVQLAQHVPTEQLVAIKFLRRGGTIDPRLIAREVRIAQNVPC